MKTDKIRQNADIKAQISHQRSDIFVHHVLDFYPKKFIAILQVPLNISSQEIADQNQLDCAKKVILAIIA